MLAVLIAFLLAPAAQASCLRAVVVDGTVLYSAPADSKVPPSAGRVRAVADRIPFTGPTVIPKRYVSPDFGSPARSFPWGFALVIGGVGRFLGWLAVSLLRA